MRACARVVVSLAMSAGLGLTGCSLNDTVSGWFDVGKLPPKDVAGVTHSVPPEIPAKKPQGASGTKTAVMTEKKGKPARKLYWPQTAEAPPGRAELVQPQTAKPPSAACSGFAIASSLAVDTDLCGATLIGYVDAGLA